MNIRKLNSVWSAVVAAVFLSLLVGCGEHSDKQVGVAKAAIEGRLTDPSSVQYRNVAGYTDGVVCGELNAKNKMGGYVGFKPFIYNAKGTGDLELIVTMAEVEAWCTNDAQKRVAAEAEKLAFEEQLCNAPESSQSRKELMCRMAKERRERIAASKR